MTYVLARNIIFESFALSLAEVNKARAIFIGAHAQDYSVIRLSPEFLKLIKMSRWGLH